MSFNEYTNSITSAYLIMGMPIKITEVLGKNSAVLHSDGLKLYDAMVEEYKASNQITLSFSNITHCTTAFLNASIGKFLSNYPNPLQVKKDLLISDLPTDSLINVKINRVIENVLDEKKRTTYDASIRTYFHED